MAVSREIVSVIAEIMRSAELFTRRKMLMVHTIEARY